MAHYADIFESLADLKMKMREGIDYRILLLDRQSQASIIAPHGGFIEAGTSHLANAVAGQTFNLYDFQGLLKSRPERLHVTSTRFRDNDLTAMLKRSLFAVSIHGMGKTDNWRIWTGGLNEALKRQIDLCLEEAGFWINPDPPLYKGRSKRNVVNLARKKGVQLELPEDLIQVMFKNGFSYGGSRRTAPEPELSPLGRMFVTAVLQGIFLYLAEQSLSSKTKAG
ncbi:MAG TPA: poly-gamma-glutamate hydrolase family protein [Candidatus Melainabacteria bacterium]|nr:poly-gamma-glutamate hydrolase family protein [Candidatus Melainabacteria bacterium]